MEILDNLDYSKLEGVPQKHDDRVGLVQNRQKPVNWPTKVEKPANFKLLKTPLMYKYSELPRPQEHDGRVGLVPKPVKTGKLAGQSRKPVNFKLLKTLLMYIYSEPPRPQEHDGRVGLVQKPVN